MAKKLIQYFPEEEYISLEAIYSAETLAMLDAKTNPKKKKALYILLTDTNTRFSKIAKFITGDPYNHVSIMLEPNFDGIYAYSLSNSKNGIFGGITKEDVEEMDGVKFSLYKVSVSDKMHVTVSEKLIELASNEEKTRYNHLGLINAIFNMDIFNTNKESMICSEFVTEILRASGIKMYSKKVASRVKPYDLVRSKMLQFVQKGKLNTKRLVSIKA